MLILVSGATVALRRHAGRGHFGRLIVPREKASPASIVASALPWACDNDAFAGFHPRRFRRMLAKYAGLPGCRFVTCPDVVCDPIATLSQFHQWSPEIRALGYPIAFVGQDGCEDGEIPWDQFEAFFVGGSTEWKESRAAMDLTDQARRLGQWVHVGRVNTFRRFRKVFDWGTVDSVDGTTFSGWSEKYLPVGANWLDQLQAQSMLGFAPSPEFEEAS